MYDNPNAHYIINLQRGVLGLPRHRLRPADPPMQCGFAQTVGRARLPLQRRASPGLCRRVEDYGISLDRKLVLAGDYTFDDGFRGARKLLALKNRPTAIFGSNDEIAAGVLAAAHSDGINVPYELSIAGFEDSPFSKQSWPLTTARQATEDLARHAAQHLIANLQREANGEPPLTTNDGFTPVLVVRDSTAPRHAGLAKR